MKHSITDLIDIDATQALMNSFRDLLSISSAIVDFKGDYIISSKRQVICTHFHSQNPQTCVRCVESNTTLANHLIKNKNHAVYKCKNGLVGAVAPVIICGDHLVNLFAGPFFLNNPDMKFFRQQARNFGFHQSSYLDSVSEVPVIPKSQIKSVLKLLSDLTILLGAAGSNKMQLLETNNALKESETRFSKTFHNLPDSITITRTSDGLYREVNDGFCRITGYSRSEVIGSTPLNLNMFVNLTDRENIIKILKEKGEVNGFELQYRIKNGSIIDTLLSARSIRYHNEDCLVAFVKNITSLRKAEREKIRLQRQLRQAHKMEAIGTLAGGIAHDFNNILFPIIGYTEMTLDAATEGSRTHSNMLEIFKAAKRARDLVKQILIFSRQSEQERKPLKIQPIIKESLKLLRASIPASIEIRHHINDDCGVILGDPTQIHQIIMNLCTNAYHAMQDIGGILTVDLTEVPFEADTTTNGILLKSGRYIRLTVSDTGHGIGHDIIDRIFDPYFTTKEPGKGTGMGLSVIHGIIKTYGGDIMVKSEPGMGSTFTIYLPVIVNPAREVHAIPSGNIPTGRESILLVDDEEQIVHMVKRTLERLGYKITAHTSSVDALETFRQSPESFDLVITDMTMPNMTGDILAKKLMNIKPEIPIILFTGFSENIDDEKAKAIGVRAYVMKPVVKSEIAAAIRRTLDQNMN